MHVLIVEDHKSSAEALALVLRREGFDVRIAASAGEAMDLCSRERFTLMLCDIELPDRDGWTLLQELREACLDVPAIALTGSDAPDTRRRSLDAGFAAHLAKPVDSEGLLEVMRWVLGLRDETTP